MTYTQGFDRIGAGDVDTAGGKGANLGEIVRAGLPVPPGFVLLTGAYETFVAANGLSDPVIALAREAEQDGVTEAFDRAAGEIGALFTGGTIPAEVATELRTALSGLGDDTAAVAVRSSATAEDLADASFAGQQDTFLHVRGPAEVEAAVVACWASLWTARAMAYRARRGIDPGGVALAVVVQTMVDADAAGVMFTADPSTGRRDRLAISAAWGLGESVVSGTVSTDDLVVDGATGRVLSQHVGDKTVMTVYAEHGTREQPVPSERRGRAVLDPAEAAALAALGTRTAAHYGAPQDIEWARAGGEFYLVQSRPVTALPEPAGDTPTDWAVPYPRGLYFRASIVEQMPDPLTPLFADLIDPAVTRSIGALMAEAFGGVVLRDSDLSLPTVNGFAYYFYSYAGFGRMLAKTPAAMVALGRGRAHMGVEGWREHSHPRYSAVVGSWADREPGELSGPELLDGVITLLDAGAEYYTAVQSIIPLAATGEIAFGAFYNRCVRRAGDPPAQTFLLGSDSEPIRAEKSLHGLAVLAGDQPGLSAVLTATPTDVLRDALRTGDAPAGAEAGAWNSWSARFREHVQRYGHAVYNLDFHDPTAADDPSPQLDTLRFYLAGHGQDPSRRQARLVDERERATAAVVGRLDPVRRAAFTRLLRRAQDTGPVREDALADVGLAWPVIRRMLLELGRRLTGSGGLDGPGDVFWLRHDELRTLASDGDRPDDLRDTIAGRRMLWRGRRRATPPQLLPRIRWVERVLAGVMPAGSAEQTGDTITGVAAGAGRVRAPARVLSGPEDFSTMRPGEVLVARITTPAWTSLFAMASAVVTDVGGPLSHSSIVAREYGIPAVLGTGAATSRIETGRLVEVDGDAGTVTLLPDDCAEA